MSIGADVMTQLTEHVRDDITQVLFQDSPVTSPLFALADQKKMDDGMGRGYVIRLETYEGAAVGAQADVVDAINGDGDTGGRPTWNRCVPTAVTIDAPFIFTRDEMLAIQGGSKAEQFDVMRRSTDAAIIRVRNMLCQQVWKKGWGLLGQITAISSTTVTVPTTIVHYFHVGQRLVASASEDTDVLLGTAAQLRVTAIADTTGVITLSGNPQSTWTNSSSLYLFRAGTRIAADPGSDASLKLSVTGMPAWVDPSGGAIFGLTRAGDRDLCGATVPGSGLSTMETLLAAAEKQFNLGRQSDLAIVSGKSFRLLQQDANSQKTVQIKIGPYQIGFAAFELATNFGSIDVVADPFLDAGSGYVGPFRTEKYAPFFAYSTKGGGLVAIDDIAGPILQPTTVSGVRSYKGTTYFRGQFIMPAPGAYCSMTSMPTS